MKAIDLINKVKDGKRLLIPSYTRSILIDKKCLKKWEKLGIDLLTDDGNGYRLRSGKGFVFVFRNQIKVID